MLDPKDLTHFLTHHGLKYKKIFYIIWESKTLNASKAANFNNLHATPIWKWQ